MSGSLTSLLRLRLSGVWDRDRDGDGAGDGDGGLGRGGLVEGTAAMLFTGAHGEHDLDNEISWL